MVERFSWNTCLKLWKLAPSPNHFRSWRLFKKSEALPWFLSRIAWHIWRSTVLFIRFSLQSFSTILNHKSHGLTRIFFHSLPRSFSFDDSSPSAPNMGRSPACRIFFIVFKMVGITISTWLALRNKVCLSKLVWEFSLLYLKRVILFGGGANVTIEIFIVAGERTSLVGFCDYPRYLSIFLLLENVFEFFFLFLVFVVLVLIQIE